MPKIDTEKSVFESQTELFGRKSNNVTATFHKHPDGGYYAEVTDPEGKQSYYHAKNLKELWYDIWTIIRIIRKIYKTLKK